MNNVYSHRNGETEPPTIAARFWFDGWRTKHNGNRVHVMDLVETNKRGGVYNDTDGETNDAVEYSGHWWGPISPPWENADE